MRTRWLYQKSADKLLVFFSGWGIDANPFSHLRSTHYDVLFIDRYLDLDFGELSLILGQYEYRVVVGWSMGVWMITRFLQGNQQKADLVLAVNGTEKPVHEEYGIDPQWFQATVEKLDQQVLDKFYRRMCGDKKGLEKFLQKKPQRSLQSLREELQFLYAKSVKCDRTMQKTPFHAACISTRDMIFSARNQNAAWGLSGITTNVRKGSHFCFQDLGCWEDLIAMIQDEKV